MALIFVIWWTVSVYGENWPGWRGPERTGVTTDRGAPVAWSATSGVRWKTALPGSGISNPIVWNGSVVCTSSDGARQQDLHVVALSLDSGKLLWHTRLWGTTPTLYHETKSSMASPSPITDGQQIYAFFGSGDVFCLDFEGRLLWHRSLAAEYGAFENRFAASSSPLLFEDSLIVQCDHYGASYVIAIDKITGENRWKTDRPKVWLSWSSPICARVPQTSEYELILCGSEKIDAFDPRTGGKLWTLGGMARECIPTPVTGHGLLLAVSGPNGTSYAIRPGGRGDITASHVVWSSTRGNPFVPSAILVGDYYYLVDDHGIGSCLDARTGKQVWRKRFGGDFTASPVSADRRIYFVNEAGTTLVIQAGIQRYQELARNALDEPVFASPAISAGNLLIRAAGRLWCLR
ncbi:MAG: PQQ-binding-like beta-propeller repeat protein [Planctomycetia bacterium]|nr:PQQ-binding-like beta-propeller repeat protein [Planctomycetia bacterium]